MAELEEGTYYVVCVGSGKVMETKKATDEQGNNVDQNTNVYGDAQIWSVSDQGNGWQFICSLSNKALNIYGGVASGKNVNVWSDNDTAAQRWSIVSDGGTYTYKNVSYDTYKIHPYSNANLSLAVQGNSTADHANVHIYTNATSNYQRWAFVPAPVLTENGTYFICPATDPSLTLVVNSGSTANGANVLLYPMRDVNHQIAKTLVTDESFETKIYFSHSNKPIEVAHGSAAVSGRNVQQWASNTSSEQFWIPTQHGTVKYDGETYPAYVLRAVVGAGLALDTKDGKLKSGTNVQVNTRNWSQTQRWIFIKTERLGETLEKPGAIEQTQFTRDGVGDVAITGLTFRSNETKFQARYMIRSYTAKRASYTDSKWMNFVDDSTSRSGWGDAWEPTFEATPLNGMVTVPFSKTVTLDSTNKSADFIVDIRVYRDNYTGYKAHGPVTRTTIKVLQVPTLTLSQYKFAYDAGNGRIGIYTKLSDSLGEGCSFLRTRILGEDGSPISEWATSSGMISGHYFGDTLIRLPEIVSDGGSNRAENLSLEYSMLTKEGLTVSGRIPFSLSYSSGSNSLEVNEINDDLVASVSGNTFTYEHCFVEVPNFGRIRLTECLKTDSSNGTSYWKCLPPLNRDVKVIKIGSENGTNWYYTTRTIRVDSHLFIWNWTDQGSTEIYDSSASVLINTDAPPEQTVTYSSAVTTNTPSQRVRPVAFASSAITSDLSVKGVVVDEGVLYQSAGPIPDSTKRDRVLRLSILSGQGIHPIYRTPYGDWERVVIESVDVSKTEMYLSNVSVNQQAVED